MAATGTPTPNIGLRRPKGTDPASVDDINYNSNLLDTKLGAVGNTSVQEQINSLNSKMSNFSRQTITSFAHNGDSWTATKSGIISAVTTEDASGVWYAYVDNGGSRIGAMSGTNGTGGLTHSFCFPVTKGETYTYAIGGITGVASIFFPIFN